MQRIRWLVVFFIALQPATNLNAQSNRAELPGIDTPLYKKQGGNLSVGLRNTISTFSHGNPKEAVTGAGGHLRLQLVNRVNTEWYADILPTNIRNKANRMDYHIGWSVMYYLIDPRGFNRKFTPYVVAGHCFDYTRIKINGENGESRKRLSTAVQAGIGCHYNITPKFDISLATQYMLHLGKELHAHEEEDGSIAIEEHKNAGWEGHLLISISVNYKFLQLWNPEKRSRKMFS
ncbi:MAG: hypothetical protein V4615_01900 [Bacteroidota bacterium]